MPVNQNPPSSRKARIIGIYGPRRAGKTCYLATALLGCSTSETCSVILDDRSREYLLQHWDLLQRGDLPPATELNLYDLSGYVVMPLSDKEVDHAQNRSAETFSEGGNGAADQRIRRRRIGFQTKDFGGRLAEQTETEVPELSNEFKKWLSEEAHGLLFLLPVDQLQDQEEAKKRLLEVDALLREILDKEREGAAIRKPVAILVTKWDLASELTYSQEEQERLEDFLSNRAGEIGRQVCEKIRNSGDRVRIFPVSAFGGHDNHGRPIRPLRPFNLHEPLVWVLRQSDFYLYEEARRKAERALQRPWIGYRTAIAAWYALINEYGITEGPIYEKAQVELTNLRQLKNRRALRVTVAAAITVFFVVTISLLSVSYSADHVRYSNLRDRIETDGGSYRELQSQVNEYGDSWNLWAWLLGHKRHIATLWQNYHTQMEQEFRTLEELCRSTPNSSENSFDNFRDQAQLYQRAWDFKNNYPDSPFEARVNQCMEDAKRKVKHWLDEWIDRCDSALDSKPADLQQLKKVWDDGNFMAGIVARVGELSNVVDVLDKKIRILADRIKVLEGDLDKWKECVRTALKVAEQALDPANESVDEMRKALKDLESAGEPPCRPPEGEVKQLADNREKTLKDLRDEIKRYQKFDEAYEELDAKVAKTSLEEEKYRLITDFLNQYSSQDYPRRKKRFDQLTRDTKAIADNIEKSRWRKMQDAFNTFLESARNSALDLGQVREKYDELVAVLDHYLNDENVPPQNPKHAQKLLGEAERLLDDREWDDVKKFAKQNDKQYEAIATKAKAYLDGNERIPANKRNHSNEAQELIRRALADRARELYRAFRDEAVQLKSTEGIPQVLKRWEDFKQWCEQPPQQWMKAFLPQADLKPKLEAGEKWVRWSQQGLVRNRVTWIEVTIDITAVDKDRQIWCEASWNGGRVKILYGGKEYDKTPWFNTPETIWVKIPAADFRKSSNLEISVTIDNYFGDTTAKVQDVRLPDVLFPGANATRNFQFPRWKGKVATMKFECEDLKPPDLPMP